VDESVGASEFEETDVCCSLDSTRAVIEIKRLSALEKEVIYRVSIN
jgi:hypothetical protein